MDDGLDTAVCKMCLQRTTFGRPHNEQVPHTGPVCGNYRQGESQTTERCQILLGDDASTIVPFVEHLELDGQECRLQLVESTVDALLEIDVLLLGPVVAEEANPAGEFRVVRCDGTRICIGAEVLPRIETPRNGISECSDRPATIWKSPSG